MSNYKIYLILNYFHLYIALTLGRKKLTQMSISLTGSAFFFYLVNASVKLGTTCFLRETTPFKRAVLFSKVTLKADSTPFA
jgi:hypothetical protein